MRQAIQTKYLGPTNYKGSRIRVECAARTKTIPWKSELSEAQNHCTAALTLIQELGWGDLQGYKGIESGTLKSGAFVHVLIFRGVK